ncbi:hypothetical protein COO60DRAFT_1559269 [Scenedesmus sp. NREL 46B-D3]|nr:hypothetical protein COO60DRAFT_1559269 [Scenedesmus sp. NREL 46B-D3]
MDAVAPAALALSISFDAVATLGLVLMSYEGPLGRALLPMTGDPHTNIAAGLGDIVLLTVLRGCLVLLPLLGIPAALSWLGAVFACQLADGHRFLVAGTGVTYHVPTLIAAEVLGVFMTWFMFALVMINRTVMLQPAGSDPAVALAHSVLQHQQLAPPRGWGRITAPLLAGAAGAAAEEEDVEQATFVSAASKQPSLSSLLSATSQPQEL